MLLQLSALRTATHCGGTNLIESSKVRSRLNDQGTAKANPQITRYMRCNRCVWEMYAKRKGLLLQHRVEAEFMWQVWIRYSSCDSVLGFMRSLQTPKQRAKQAPVTARQIVRWSSAGAQLRQVSGLYDP